MAYWNAWCVGKSPKTPPSISLRPKSTVFKFKHFVVIDELTAIDLQLLARFVLIDIDAVS